MAPNVELPPPMVPVDTDEGDLGDSSSNNNGKDEKYRVQIVWANVAKFTLLHAFSLAGIAMLPQTSWKTNVFAFVCYVLSTLVRIKKRKEGLILECLKLSLISSTCHKLLLGRLLTNCNFL